MKWYVVVKADSYLLWASLLEYLAVLDPSRPHYTGSVMYIGDQSEIEALTDAHWAGDCVLGKVFSEAGVRFTDAWPIMQGDYPGIVAYARPDGRHVADTNKRVWCYPTVSYHHMSPDAIEDIWNFEQQWMASKPEDVRFLRHKDVFKQYILPRMATDRLDWDNESDGEDENDVESFERCKAKCEAAAECRQFSFSDDGHCKTCVDPRLGKASPGMRSGWLYDRIARFEADMPPCREESWMM